jgi:predicted ATP-dependent serine protease
MHLIASEIIKVAKSVRWLELPDIPEKGDLTDWLEVKDNSHTKFQELIDKSTEWNKETKEESLVVLTLNELLNKKITPRQYLLSPWLQSQGLCMIYSTRGFGKTWVSLEIAFAVATGGQFLSWKSDNPTGVLYIDGETALGDLQNRVKQIDMRVGNKLQTPLKFLSRDAQEADFPNLSTAEGQRQIESLIRDDIKLVILDNISTLFRSGKEYESDSWLPIQNWLLSLRSLGKSVLLIHHAGKGGQQRGTSRREDVLDTVISLKRPTDYIEEEGARIEFHFEKSRSLLGDEVKPFEARLESKANHEGIQVHKWTWKSLKDSKYESVCRLANEGLENWEIAQDLDIHKSTVSRYVQSGKEEGAIKP